MTSSRWLRRVVAFGGVMTAVSLSPAAGIASADSMYTPLVNTTCSYAQIVAALQVEAPDLATLLNEYPQARTKLQQFLALPMDQRQQRIQQQLAANPQWQSAINEKSATPEGQHDVQIVTQVAQTCHNY